MLKQECKKDFIKRLNSLTGRFTMLEVFRDWCEVAAICSHQIFYNVGVIPHDERFQALEEKYLSFVSKYEREGLTIFSEMFGLVRYVLSREICDFLGEIYQELGFGNFGKGEFFTPFSVAKTMAALSLEKQSIERCVQEKGYISLQEPTCGSGNLLLAACEVLIEQGYDPRKIMYFEATDINVVCCHLTYIQLSALNVPGLVIHGNSLSGEEWDKWLTPALQVSVNEKADLGILQITKMIAALQLLEGESSSDQSQEEHKGEKRSQISGEIDQPRQLDLFLDIPDSTL